MTVDDPHYAQEALAKGSQSFAAATRLFDPATRADVTTLYAWCRHCDDVVDGQLLGRPGAELGGSPAERLALLRQTTQDMLAGVPINHPAWAGLPAVMARHAMPSQYLFDHLDGFALDVEGAQYASLDDLLRYCYGVAGVVGLMMARIMGVKDPAVLDRACDLGLAFQLTNIARDVGEDHLAGRLYLPRQWLDASGISPDDIGRPEAAGVVAALAARLVAEAEPYYASALAGIGDLPWRAGWAIGAARLIYRRIGTKVSEQGPVALTTRVSTSTNEKLVLLLGGFATATIARFGSPTPRPATLWQRPARD